MSRDTALNIAEALLAASKRSLPLSRLLQMAESDEQPSTAELASFRELGVYDLFAGDWQQEGVLTTADAAALFVSGGRAPMPATVRNEMVCLSPLLFAAAQAGDPDADRLQRELAEGRLRGGGSVLLKEASGVHWSGNSLSASELIGVFPPAPLVGYVVSRERAALVELQPTNSGVSHRSAVDPGQGMSRFTVQGRDLPGHRVFGRGVAEPIWVMWQIALLAEIVGAAQESLNVSVAYARQRRQFGRPIAGFQAVSHRLADMVAAVEVSRSSLSRLAELWDAGDVEFDEALAAMRHWIPKEARTVVESAIQVHGAMGFTWEYGLHLYYRRVLAGETLLGGADNAAREVGERMISAAQLRRQE